MSVLRGDRVDPPSRTADLREPMEIINQSFDALRVNAQGCLPKKMLSALHSAKSKAEQSGEETHFAWASVRGLVKGNGTKGGYAFIFDTGPLGETWLFKRSGDATQWNIRVEIRAIRLRLEGYSTCRDYIIQTLKLWGCQIKNYSIGGLDYAVDIDMGQAFKLDPYKFVCHSRMKIKPYSDSSTEETAADNTFQPIMQSNRMTSVTIGSKGNRQIQVYDKRAEQMNKGSSEWFTLWGRTKDDSPVWRVEVRLFNKHLKDWNIRTFEDLERGLGDVLLAALEDVRYCDKIDAHNASRSKIHPMWLAALSAIENAFSEMRDGRERGKVIKAKRTDFQNMMEGQVVGCAKVLCLAHDIIGTEPEQIEKTVSFLSDTFRSYMLQRSGDWARGQTKAANRMNWAVEENETDE